MFAWALKGVRHRGTGGSFMVGEATAMEFIVLSFQKLSRVDSGLARSKILLEVPMLLLGEA